MQICEMRLYSGKIMPGLMPFELKMETEIAKIICFVVHVTLAGKIVVVIIEEYKHNHWCDDSPRVPMNWSIVSIIYASLMDA